MLKSKSTIVFKTTALDKLSKFTQFEFNHYDEYSSTLNFDKSVNDAELVYKPNLTNNEILISNLTSLFNNSIISFSSYSYLSITPALNANASSGLTGLHTGKVSTDFYNFIDEANCVFLQMDGKILVAGNSGNLSSGTGDDWALVRYNSDGSLDNSFGTGGKVSTSFGYMYESAQSIVLQEDGKILVGGWRGVFPYDDDFAVARYNVDGSLDNSFGLMGKVVTEFGAEISSGFSIALQADGKILLAGFAYNFPNGEDFALVRYTADGSLDTSFDGDGKVTTSFSNLPEERASSVLIQQDGKIILAGYSYSNHTNTDSDFDFALARYNTDGSSDPSFGSNGKVTTDFGSSYDRVQSAVLQTDGKILVAGSINNQDFGVARYNTDGSLDSSFDGDGKLTLDFFGWSDVAYGIALQNDGKILLTGSAGTGIGNDFALVRLNSNGSVDTSFDGDGKLTTAFNPYYDNAQGVIVQPNGKIVVAGSDGYDFNLARYNADGSLDASFGALYPNVSDIAATPLSGLNHIDSLIDNGPGWNWLLPSRNVLYYTFSVTTGNETGNTEISDNLSAFNATQHVACLNQLSYISQLTGISFAEASDATQADIHFASTDIISSVNTSGLCSWSYVYSTDSGNNITDYSAEAYIYLDNNEWGGENGSPIVGNFGYETLLHELGHALGLKHPFEGTQTLASYEDNTNFSIMSYNQSGIHSTFSPFDVAALMWLYGGDGLGGSLGVSTSGVYIVGTYYSNLLNGGAGNDFLEGMEGSDQLVGGGGNDVMVGGDGNDFYYVDSINDFITETNSDFIIGGIDTIYSSVSTLLGGNLENLTLTSNSAINGTGNALNNTIVGNLANNTLTGGAGGDTLDGGDGIDTADYSALATAVTAELWRGNATNDGTGSIDTFISIENLIGGMGNDTLTGNAVNNIINGGAGNDTVHGGAGNDTVIGGLGNDTMIGGTGADTLEGGDGIDTADYSALVTTVTAELWRGNATNDGSGSIDTFIAIENLIGGSNSDILTGNAMNNIINGGAGNDYVNGGVGNDTVNGGAGTDTVLGGTGDDTLIGGTGADTLDGGDGIDTADYSALATAVTAELWKGNATNDGSGSIDTFIAIENLIGGSNSDILTGNAVNNIINGGSGNDTVNGGAGNDTVIGGLGKDTITGGTGTDIFDFNALLESVVGVNRDIITDFSTAQLDKIDLSTIDANSTLANDQAFLSTILTSGDFNAIGQLRLVGNILSGNTDANFTTSEFEIQLTGVSSVTAGDFVL